MSVQIFFDYSVDDYAYKVSSRYKAVKPLAVAIMSGKNPLPQDLLGLYTTPLAVPRTPPFTHLKNYNLSLQA